MTRLSLEELDRISERYDRSVLATPDIDRFCSSSVWVLPAAKWLHASPRPFIVNEGDSWVALIGDEHLHPLEAMWGLSSPLIGEDPVATSELFVRAVDRELRPILIAGIGPRSRIAAELVQGSRRRFEVARGPRTRRYVASIASGLESYLSRRTADFRKSIRRARRRCDARGIRFELADTGEPEEAFTRILRIERRSWKGMRGVGIDTEPMCSFYRDINRRLVGRGARRLAFATLDGRPIAYILGGVFGDTYRGLQFSFDHRYSDLSLGNVCQIHEIDRLSREGLERYDLGTEVRYKRRWADEVVTTTALILRPRP